MIGGKFSVQCSFEEEWRLLFPLLSLIALPRFYKEENETSLAFACPRFCRED